MTLYFGKYRGKVENNIDPLGLGRIQVSVPRVLGRGKQAWADPCVPYAGDGVGLFAIPPNKASVWVEFEGGESDSPIWTGCFWERGQAPAKPAVAEVTTLKTKSCTLTLSELPGPAGGITIETAGMKIALTSAGLEINNGKGGVIKLTGKQVSVNDGALEVT
jgi:Type VI secretion system/phage-baseplate injector OB domain